MKVCYNIETKVVVFFVVLLFCKASVGAKADDYVSCVVASPVFEQNMGQIVDVSRKRCDNVFFKAEINGATVFFTNEDVTFVFSSAELSEYMQIKMGIKENPYPQEKWQELRRKVEIDNYEGDEVKKKVKSTILHLKFPGANLTKANGEEKKMETHNYFTPEIPDGLYGVLTFQKIRYANVYPNVDLLFYFENGLLKYNFELQPNASPSDIKLLFVGQKSVSLDEKGNVVVEAENVKLCDHAPKCYQEGNSLDSRFYLDMDTVRFSVDGYDNSKALVIDPELTWSTYFHDGTSTQAFNSWVTRPLWDSKGDMFLIMSSSSNSFPTVDFGGNAYFEQSDGGLWASCNQVQIVKYNTNKEVVWATYYCNTQDAYVNSGNQSAVIDNNDNLYIAGHLFYAYSSAESFPLYNPGGGAYYETGLGNNRNFILEFNALTGQRLWATMFCTRGNYSSSLEIKGLAVDNDNNLIVTGVTYTPDNSWTSIPFPATNPAGHYVNASPTEEETPFLARFNGTSHALNWSTYISRGGSGAYVTSQARIAIDKNNSIYITSAYSSSSAAFSGVNPGSSAYYSTTLPSSRRIALYRFSSSGALNWATLYGSTNANWEDCYDSGIDENGNLIIVGLTLGSNFYTKNPGGGAYFQSALSVSGKADGFISKFNSSGSVIWSTYIGGGSVSTTESYASPLYSMGLDLNGNLYVSGYSYSPSYPLMEMTGSYYQSTFTGNYAPTISMFDANGVMKWSTYFGYKAHIATGGFNCRKLCGDKIVRLGYINNNSGSVPTINTNGYDYYHTDLEGTGSYNTDFIAEFKMTGVLPDLDLSGIEDEYCLNSTPVTLPTTINGIVGTWSPATISTSAIVTDAPYVFTPTNTCYLPETLPVDVINCCTELAQPTLTVTSQTDRSVTVSWNSISHASSYTLYYGVNDPNSSTSNVWSIPNATSPMTIPELTNGQPYNFAVMPVGSDPYCPENDLSPTRVGTPVCDE